MSDQRIYNLKPDLPDHRDRLFIPSVFRDILHFFDPAKPIVPPSEAVIDLRPEMPPVYDQGQLGSCLSNAIAADIQYLTKHPEPSRLFLYYNDRVVQG
ncbi:MAG: hypothetical protein ACYCOU_04210, partial [Sulfobacillus sp.]